MSAVQEKQAAEVAPNLFRIRGDAVHLLAGKEHRTGRLAFPLPESDWESMFEAVELPPNGKLWTWTIQRFCPKPPYDGDLIDDDFRPFAVGYVEFPGLIIVQGRILLDDFDALRTGVDVRTVLFPYRTLDDGTGVMTYAFELAESAS